MSKIKIKPDNKEIEIEENTSFLQTLVKEGYRIKSSCGGHGSCGDCVIKVIEGKESLNPLTFEEGQLLGNVFYITKERLACQTKCSGNVEIDISHHLES